MTTIDHVMPTPEEAQAIATLRDDIARGVHPLATDVAILLGAFERCQRSIAEAQKEEATCAPAC
ncbi:hypothetical protein [Afipia carboxidovorans]|uniref:hypothetical protein n=1 Tax=Afipia carboxidovorans TaxID=40137 RepID=UPI00308FD13D|nr:hypothetical protein CRBSH125_05660 [Afipia carboxidovorans]